MLICFEPPTTRDSLLAALTGIDRQATALWQSFDPPAFFQRPAGGGWSPAQNVVHLHRSTVPVIWSLRMPKPLLGILFGRPPAASRSFAEIRAIYRQTLASGGQAGMFGPSRQRLPRDAAAAQAQSLDRWRKIIPALSTAVGRWDETALDRYRMPHPLLGRLSVREMLHFTVYHLAHHSEIVAGRQNRPSES